MTVQAWIILTPVQAAASTNLNASDVAVAPRLVNNTLANNLGLGTMVGKYVLPARLLNDPAYVAWVPSLGGLSISTMDSDVLFQPPTGL